MREQVVVRKVGNRSGLGSGRRSTGSAQRPARRERSRSRESVSHRLKGLVGYLPLVLKLTVAITLGITLFMGYRAAASASFFELQQVEVKGTARASSEDVQQAVQSEVKKTGVWNADLADLSAKLEQLPWIRSAVVSRVLPDSIRVRIVEREPRVVVRTNAGRLRWVDEDAVFLGEMGTADQMPAFFLRGLSEDDSETAHVENVERVRRFIQFERECVAAGIADRVSEVNLSDVRDVRVQLSGEDSQIEVRLGSEEAGKRLKSGLEVLDGQRRTPRGQYISYVDLSQGKRAVIGFVSGAHVATAAGSATDNVPVNRSAASQRSNQASGSDEQKKKEKKEKNKREAG